MDIIEQCLENLDSRYGRNENIEERDASLLLLRLALEIKEENITIEKIIIDKEKQEEYCNKIKNDLSYLRKEDVIDYFSQSMRCTTRFQYNLIFSDY